MRSKTPALLAALVLVAGGSLWFVSRGGDATGRGSAPRTNAPATDEATPPGTTPAAELAPATPVGTDPTTSGQRTAAEPRAQTPLTVNHDGFDTSNANWIDVEVPFPAGAPRGETLRVIAFSASDGERYEDWNGNDIAGKVDLTDSFADGLPGDAVWARRELDGAGRARLPIHPEAPNAVLVLQARYVFAPPTFVEADARTVTLDTGLGAWITGRCVLPESTLAAGRGAEDVELGFHCSTGRGQAFGLDFEDSREVRLNDELGFALRAVAAPGKAIYRAVGEGFVDRMEMNLPALQPGEHRELEIVLSQGATVAGRITGEDGSPIGGAEIAAGTNALILIDGNSEETVSAADGTYVLTGLAAGKVQLSVEAQGWLPAEELQVEVVDGQRTDGFDVVLSRGNSVLGRVVWPDGTPAVGAQVTALQKRRGGWREESARTSSGESGAFELSGLGKGPFEVQAHLDPEGGEDELRLPDRMLEVAERFEDVGELEEVFENWQVGSPTTWRAVAKRVEANATGLLLTLEEPVKLTGRVLDDRGAPIAAFSVTARPASANRWEGRDVASQSFQTEDGAFELGGLFPGKWSLAAEANGYSPAEDGLTITIPHVGSPVVITLDRGVTLAGTVVDPNGNPIENASVLAQTGSEEDWGEGSSEDTDASGAFAFERVALGGLFLVASHDDWASSETLPIDLAPGESLDDIVLQLRNGGTITGEVYDSQGQPAVGQNVQAGSGGFGFGGGEDTVVTDEAGFFQFDNVTPGQVMVVAMPDQNQILETIQESGGDETAMMNFVGQMKMEAVEVEDGGTVHVVLGDAALAPVRVVGTIREAGEPLAATQVVVFEEGGALIQGMKATRSDEQGRYEILLDRPGDFVFNVGSDGVLDAGSIPFYVDIPEVEEHQLDLSLPLGKVSGRVTAPDGAPAEDVTVRVSREGGLLGLTDMTGNQAVTQADGTYSFEHLEPGSYTVRVGGLSNFGSSESRGFGAMVQDGIELAADEHVDGIDFQLSEAGKLTGTVRDGAGSPVARATVFVRDEGGRILSQASSCITDAAGRFTYEGIQPGRFTLRARTGDLACEDSPPVVVAAGEATEVDLVLEGGVDLLVSLTDEGEPVRARVEVLDDEGRPVGGLLSTDDLESLFAQGFDSRERRVGPVPPGRYTLIATSLDGKEARKTVTVRAGKEERRVRLRLR